MRYAGGRPLFLLSELITWTLPHPDVHSEHRLSMAAAGNIAMYRLATNQERKDLDAGIMTCITLLALGQSTVVLQ